MERVRRVLVHFCKDGAAQPAHFVQSITGHFSEGGEDEVEVGCSLERNRFILHRADAGRGGVTLKRHAFCPIKHLSVTENAALPLDVQQRGVDVGVATILQTANQRVLLTRRAKELRIFPNIWVPPGGHLELDETLLDAGLRELQEETGLKLEPEEGSPNILGLWESVFPALLSRGLPQRHHIVVYLLLRSPLSHLELQASLSPSPAEVSACLWADRQLVSAVVSDPDGENHDLQRSVSVSQVSADGALSDSSLPLEVFLSRAPVSGPDVERVSSGTMFALNLWLRSLDDL
ncbi:Nucleoside diphosphate-linked moiety X motif 17 [Dissostichus eleginoides]|uniref:m7GpppN-mRNA hydrolase NUDT17 n=1 Tax=Dissostichus eleginoides TaxID=100907 RepID=A0AAD9FB63_DISEL|nr:Nucleoside diphosphate-linked moiety X motif 17 [Dissostichus eleginoides]